MCSLNMMFYYEFQYFRQVLNIIFRPHCHCVIFLPLCSSLFELHKQDKTFYRILDYVSHRRWLEACYIEFRNPILQFHSVYYLCSQNKWADQLCGVHTVFIMMMYIHAEREADWCLHLTAVKEMLLYFFAAGHVNYARYGITCVPWRWCQSHVKNAFLKENMSCAMSLASGMAFGVTCSSRRHSCDMDMENETLLAWHWNLKHWRCGLHICSRIKQDLSQFTNPDDDTGCTDHKDRGVERTDSCW